MASPRFPEPPERIADTPLAKVDEAVGRLKKNSKRWVETTIGERLSLLRRCLDGVEAVAEDWVRGGCRLKGIDFHHSLAGEEWLAGPVVTARNIRLLIDALEAGGQPKAPKTEQRHGRTIATVFPTDLKDRAMFTGFSAEVWIEPGKPASQGEIYQGNHKSEGAVALVLGAGNVSSIPPMDALHKLFVENQVVMLKMNPVNEHVGKHLEKAFRCLIEEGFFAVCYGGIEVGAHLSDHADVDTLHVTGSDRTYDAIVWGSDPEEQARRKSTGKRKNERPFTAELGCVTPVFVVPGPWSEADIDFQARHVAGMVAQNASFNCNAAKAMVVARDWPLRDAFVARVRSHLAGTEARKAYYPGAESRYQGFVSNYPEAEAVGQKGEGIVPWTMIPNVKPSKSEYALSNEAFCGVLAVVDLPVGDPGDFLTAMVPFGNDECWGTLSCMMLIHPDTQKSFKTEYENAIRDLRYGGIGVNVWAALVYGLVCTTWGAFPGHPPEDIQSGTGVVHNTFLFDHPEKSVVYAPFRIKPTPAWFADHKNLDGMSRRLFEMEVKPSWPRLVKLAAAAFRG